MQKSVMWTIVLIGLVLVVGAIVWFSTGSGNLYGNTGTQNPGAYGNQVMVPNPGSTETQTGTGTGTTQNVLMSSSNTLGNILVGTNGRTLYMFKADSNGQSACSGSCANAWPPLIVASGVIPAGTGITTNLGIINRTDGTFQVTADGMPLYYYIGDSGAGNTNGQGVLAYGAKWYVVSSSGQVIMTSTSSGGGSSGGGY